MLPLLLLPVALALDFTPEAEVEVEVGTTVVDVTLADLDGSGILEVVVLTTEALLVWGDAGLVTWRTDVQARQVIAADLDEDGADDLILCGPDGLVLLDLVDAAGDRSLHERSCRAAALLHLDDDGMLDAVSVDEAVLVFPGSADGGLDEPTDFGLRLTGTPVLGPAPSLDLVYVGELDAEDFWGVDLDAESAWEAGGALGGLAGTSDGPAWSLPGTSSLETPVAGVALAVVPGLVVAVDVDGDGREELAVLAEEGTAVLVVDAGGEAETVLVTLWLDEDQVASGRPVLGDLDGDDCVDLVLPLGTAVGSWRGGDCAVSTEDGDGDGYSAADGDCDDGEAAVFPGAEETCDGLDNDCDDEVDELSFALVVAPDDPVEGDTLEAEATASGCVATLELEVDAPAAVARCEQADAAASCRLVDDGDVVLRATMIDDDGHVHELEELVSVANAAPEVLTRWLADHWSATDEDTDFEAALEAADPGEADVLTWTLLDGPDGMDLDATTGVLRWTVPAGLEDRLELVVEVADDDGERHDVTLQLDVRNVSVDLDLTCCCGSTGAILLPPWFLWSARRRQRSARAAEPSHQANR